MNSQNTPVHIRLWHHDFWRMAFANMLLTMSVYMLIPIMPRWLMESGRTSTSETGWLMGVFAVGLFVLGAFTSFLVQHYRRNQVCVWAALVMDGCLLWLYYIEWFECHVDSKALLYLQRFCFGAAFGLAQMVLGSTLIIDTSESYQRTEANHAASWFGRFALSLGPLAGLLVYPVWGFKGVLLIASGCVLLAVILVMLVHFPFRAPEDHVAKVSLDRFFLPQSLWLFLNLLLITLSAGLLLSLPFDVRFYGMMMMGFLTAILAQRFVFREADLKSEVVSGLVLMIAAQIMLLTRSQTIVSYVAPLFVGFALGIIGSRFLLFFIKLSHHCQRGTSQSTYMLGWESGLALGVGVGYAVFASEPRYVLIASLVLSVGALVLYQFTHRWFLIHKNR